MLKSSHTAAFSLTQVENCRHNIVIFSPVTVIMTLIVTPLKLHFSYIQEHPKRNCLTSKPNFSQALQKSSLETHPHLIPNYPVLARTWLSGEAALPFSHWIRQRMPPLLKCWESKQHGQQNVGYWWAVLLWFCILFARTISSLAPSREGKLDRQKDGKIGRTGSQREKLLPYKNYPPSPWLSAHLHDIHVISIRSSF